MKYSRSSLSHFNLVLLAMVLLLDFVPMAQAATRQIVYQLNGSDFFSASSLHKKANEIATTETNQAFADAAVSQISLTIVAEQGGQIMPILVLNVTRENWQRQSNIQVWAKYPGGVNRLLGFDRRYSQPQIYSISSGSNPIRDQMTEREANFYDQR